MLTYGDTYWGHDTGVTETNVRDFAGNWSGTGSIVSSGDDEQICLSSGQYMESEVVQTFVGGTVSIYQNKYDITGDDVLLRYRHGNSEANCLAASWQDYTVPFASLGFVQVRVESTL